MDVGCTGGPTVTVSRMAPRCLRRAIRRSRRPARSSERNSPGFLSGHLPPTPNDDTTTAAKTIRIGCSSSGPGRKPGPFASFPFRARRKLVRPTSEPASCRPAITASRRASGSFLFGSSYWALFLRLSAGLARPLAHRPSRSPSRRAALVIAARLRIRVPCPRASARRVGRPSTSPSPR